jgi:hypothetical protein
MRLWSLHPKYLDRQGLLACWREALLAQKVLQGETKGYRHHPQLIRFRLCPHPLAAIATYLVSIAEEAEARAYVFNRLKIAPGRLTDKLPVTSGQVLYEWAHLQEKLARRDPLRLAQLSGIGIPECHPLFEIVPGDVEPWERRPDFYTQSLL